jgi:hypothetical protein
MANDLAEPRTLKSVGASAIELDTSDKYDHRGLRPDKTYEMSAQPVYEMPGWTDTSKHTKKPAESAKT